MAEAMFTFPKGFLWGSATSSHQVEGNNKNNNWWAWEQEPGRILGGQESGLACDWWGGRWREDFDRAVEDGQNAHRLSIEWSRIQPAPDRWDETALDYYREIIRGLLERDMTPMVTLHHFTDPLWVYEQSGWEQDISNQFAAYVEKVVEALKEYVSLWVTINEPNVYTILGYMLGEFPPGKTQPLQIFRVYENLLRGHAAAYQVIHRIQPTAQVGIAYNYRGMAPLHPWNPLDRWAANFASWNFNEIVPTAVSTGRLYMPFWRKTIRGLKDTQDFMGVNYYTQEFAWFSPGKPSDLFIQRDFAPNAEVSPTGFIANIPEGFYAALKWATKFGLPIYITENGVEDNTDMLRPRYLAEHIHQVWRGINFNWPIKGYFHWSLVDNFEWDRGWTQRFGLWELDVDTQARRKRQSAELFASICKANGLSSDMVAEFAPAVLGKLFPD